MAHDIFISYSTKDQHVVNGLSAFLEQKGIGCFIASRDIPNGIVWAKAVTEAIENCKLMVVVFSENFNSSKQVDREIEMCIEEGKSILTYKIENVEFKGVKKYFLKNLNWIDAFPNPEKSFEKLYDNILRLLPEISKEKGEEQKSRSAEEQKAEKQKSRKINNTLNPYSQKTPLVEEKPLFPKSSLSSKRKPVIPLLIMGGVIVLVVASVLYYINNKPENIQENNAPTNEETINIEPLPQEHPSAEIDTSIQIINKIELQKENNKPSTAVSTNKNDNNRQPSETKIEYVKRSYSSPTILVSTSGEQFEVAEGDSFEGEVEKGTGKIIQGKVKDKDNKIKHLFLLKRNQ